MYLVKIRDDGLCRIGVESNGPLVRVGLEATPHCPHCERTARLRGEHSSSNCRSGRHPDRGRGANPHHTLDELLATGILARSGRRYACRARIPTCLHYAAFARSRYAAHSIPKSAVLERLAVHSSASRDHCLIICDPCRVARTLRVHALPSERRGRRARSGSPQQTHISAPGHGCAWRSVRPRDSWERCRDCLIDGKIERLGDLRLPRHGAPAGARARSLTGFPWTHANGIICHRSGVDCPTRASVPVRATVMARVTGDGLPVRRHGTATVASATIRRFRPQSGAAFATRTAFVDEHSSVRGEASAGIVPNAFVDELQALCGGLSS